MVEVVKRVITFEGDD